MDILEESRMMLELAINSLQRAGHDVEHFERTVAKIKKEQVKKLNIDDVSNQRELLIDFVKWHRDVAMNYKDNELIKLVDNYIEINL